VSGRLNSRAVLPLKALERERSAACVSDPARIICLFSRQHGCYINCLVYMIIMYFKVCSVFINMCIQ
jgi:hypothetical protein